MPVVKPKFTGSASSKEYEKGYVSDAPHQTAWKNPSSSSSINNNNFYNPQNSASSGESFGHTSPHRVRSDNKNSRDPTWSSHRMKSSDLPPYDDHVWYPQSSSTSGNSMHPEFAKPYPRSRQSPPNYGASRGIAEVPKQLQQHREEYYHHQHSSQNTESSSQYHQGRPDSSSFSPPTYGRHTRENRAPTSGWGSSRRGGSSASRSFPNSHPRSGGDHSTDLGYTSEYISGKTRTSHWDRDTSVRALRGAYSSERGSSRFESHNSQQYQHSPPNDRRGSSHHKPYHADQNYRRSPSRDDHRGSSRFESHNSQQYQHPPPNDRRGSSHHKPYHADQNYRRSPSRNERRSPRFDQERFEASQSYHSKPRYYESDSRAAMRHPHQNFGAGFDAPPEIPPEIPRDMAIRAPVAHPSWQKISLSSDEVSDPEPAQLRISRQSTSESTRRKSISESPTSQRRNISEPLTEQNQPLTKQSQPLTEQKQSLTEQNQSPTKQNQPLTEQKQPLIEQKQSLTEQKQSLTEQKQPLTEQKQPLTKQNQPLAEQNQPLTEKNQPPTQQNQHHLNIFEQLTEQNKPLTKQKQHHLNISEPLTEQPEKNLHQNFFKPEQSQRSEFTSHSPFGEYQQFKASFPQTSNPSQDLQTVEQKKTTPSSSFSFVLSTSETKNRSESLSEPSTRARIWHSDDQETISLDRTLDLTSNQKDVFANSRTRHPSPEKISHTHSDARGEHSSNRGNYSSNREKDSYNRPDLPPNREDFSNRGDYSSCNREDYSNFFNRGEHSSNRGNYSSSRQDYSPSNQGDYSSSKREDYSSKRENYSNRGDYSSKRENYSNRGDYSSWDSSSIRENFSNPAQAFSGRKQASSRTESGESRGENFAATVRIDDLPSLGDVTKSKRERSHQNQHHRQKDSAMQQGGLREQIQKRKQEIVKTESAIRQQTMTLFKKRQELAEMQEELGRLVERERSSFVSSLVSQHNLPAHVSPSWRYAGALVVSLHQNKLFVLIGIKVRRQGQRWVILGGKREEGETPAHTVLRELNEEVPHLSSQITADILHNSPLYYLEQCRYALYVVTVKYSKTKNIPETFGKNAPTHSKFQQLRWVPLSEAPDMLVPWLSNNIIQMGILNKVHDMYPPGSITKRAKIETTASVGASPHCEKEQSRSFSPEPRASADHNFEGFASLDEELLERETDETSYDASALVSKALEFVRRQNQAIPLALLGQYMKNRPKTLKIKTLLEQFPQHFVITKKQSSPESSTLYVSLASENDDQELVPRFLSDLGQNQ